jgi:hypothetical protein
VEEEIDVAAASTSLTRSLDSAETVQSLFPAALLQEEVRLMGEFCGLVHLWKMWRFLSSFYLV